MTTTFGLFQTAYQGTPLSSFADVGLGCCGQPIEGTYIFGRGNWVNETADSAGAVTFGSPFARRTPWYTQTDFNFAHSIKVNKNNERQVLAFQANISNLLNQHSPVSFYEGLNSANFSNGLFEFQIFGGAPFYKTVESGYNAQQQATASGLIKSSWYGTPNIWQLSRNIRLGVSFTF